MAVRIDGRVRRDVVGHRRRSTVEPDVSETSRGGTSVVHGRGVRPRRSRDDPVSFRGFGWGEGRVNRLLGSWDEGPLLVSEGPNEGNRRTRGGVGTWATGGGKRRSDLPRRLRIEGCTWKLDTWEGGDRHPKHLRDPVQKGNPPVPRV